jgi:hypothetical protein
MLICNESLENAIFGVALSYNNKVLYNFIYLFVLLICDAFEIWALSLIIVTF